MALVGAITGNCPDQRPLGAIIDLADGTVVREFIDLAGQVQAISPDGRVVFHQTIANPGPDTTCADAVVGPIQARDATTGALISEFDGLCTWLAPTDCPPDGPYPEWLSGISVSGDGGRVAAGGASGMVSMWDASTGSMKWSWEIPGGAGPLGGEWVSDVSIAPDDSHVAVARGSGESVVILDPGGTEIVSVPTSERWTVEHTPDGSRVVLAGTGLTVVDPNGWETVWDVADPHDSGVLDFDVSPDGTKIVTAGSDGLIRVWSVESGKLAHEVDLGDDWAKAVVFTENDEVLVGTDAGLVVTLTVDTERLIDIARSRLIRDLTEQECRTSRPREACAG